MGVSIFHQHIASVNAACVNGGERVRTTILFLQVKNEYNIDGSVLLGKCGGQGYSIGEFCTVILGWILWVQLLRWFLLGTFFSSLDLKHAYYSVSIAAENTRYPVGVPGYMSLMLCPWVCPVPPGFLLSSWNPLRLTCGRKVAPFLVI